MSTFIEGIDVSNHNGLVNWSQERAAGISWAAVKASEGDRFVDRYYHLNVVNARAAGVLVMPYHFLSHDIPAKAQAAHFLGIIDRAHNKDLLLPAVDVEPDPLSTHALKNRSGGAYGTSWPASYMVRLLDDFLSYVRDGVDGIPGLGKNLTIYSYQDWWLHYMGDTHNYAQACPLWVAAYPTVHLPLFGAWPYYTMHQYTDHGNVAGLYVDRNVFKGTLDDLKKFANY